MENFSYNSYPDSGDSSPRSREIDFENPPPWEEREPSSQASNYKAKFMCSYGGKIHPRPHDNQLSYIGGETKILSVDRSIKFSQFISKLSAVIGDNTTDVAFKYQLPGEDLDALISVTNDDDLEHMMHEYDRLYRASGKPARMRLFLFPIASPGSFSSDRSDRERFVEAEKVAAAAAAAAAASNVDFLFGLEKGVHPPPIAAIKVLDPVPDPTPPPELHVVDRFVGSDHAKIQEKVQPPPVSMPPGAVQHPMSVPAQGYWQEKQISAGGYHNPGNINHTSEQPVYMIPASGQGSGGPPPGTVFHHHPQAPIARPMTGQNNQAYYNNVQRMHPDMYREQQQQQQQQQQQVYNMVQTQAQPMSMAPPQQAGMGMVKQGVDAGYPNQMAYDGRQLYYTAPGGMVVPVQYQGVGMPVNGSGGGGGGGSGGVVPEGKVVVTKVSQV
ncbi:hypothetical protein ACFE04_024223 [Oxalis oulophora]